MKADTIMKNKIILLLFLLFPVIIFAQTLQDYTVKSKFVYGNILKHTIHLNNLEKSPCHRAGLDMEWQAILLIYTYNIDNEDGWFCTRASLKYVFTNHIFTSLGLKTHLQKAELIEWGMGYRF